MRAYRFSASRRRFWLPLVIGISAVLGLSGPAAAWQMTRDEGTRGTFRLQDFESYPGGKCGYGEPNGAGNSAFRWMRVKAPRVFAVDRTAHRDAGTVSWRLFVQRKRTSGPWTTVATSSRQVDTAYDDAAAPFQALKVPFEGGLDMSVLRGLVIINWYRSDGSVEGSVRLTIDYYSVDWQAGSPDYVFTDGSCTSKAD